MSDPATPTPPVAPPVATPTASAGAANYAFGFVALFPVPVFGLLVAAILMIVLGVGSRRKGGAVAENGRRAANWGITVLLLLVITVGILITLATVFANTRGFFPTGSIIFVYLAVWIAHVVVSITGSVVASRGNVFHNRIAIPFLR
jgi:hypothetical protein